MLAEGGWSPDGKLSCSLLDALGSSQTPCVAPMARWSAVSLSLCDISVPRGTPSSKLGGRYLIGWLITFQ
jgi:hypothetical protein